MNRNLLPPISSLFTSPSSKSFGLLLILVLVLNFGITSKINAQCIGPYQKFESMKTIGNAGPPATGMRADGWTFSASPPSISTLTGLSRSGGNSLILAALNRHIQTPLIATPQDFAFYYRNQGNTSTVTFKAEYASASDPNFTSPTLLANLVANSATNPTNYTLYSVNLSSLSNVFIRISWLSNTGTVPTLLIDDISWTSRSAAENTVVVPVQQGSNVVPSNCSGGNITVGPTTVYEFYDNGGNGDSYNINQNNTITFTPSGTGFTAGDRVRVRFVSYAGGAGDRIDVWDNNGTLATTNILAHTLPGLPTITTYISTISADGSLTVRFTSDGATNAVGFNILVDCVRCPIPTGLTTTAVGSTSASLSWNTTSASAYDVYYNTTGSLPNGLITPTNANIATNTLSLSGLTISQMYYVWVRSRCGSSPDSYSPWSAPINFSTVDCSAFLISTNPSSDAQSLCKDVSATALTVAANGGTGGYTYQWYSNVANSNVGGTAISGETSDSHQPSTTTAGTLYYYCVITSVTPACIKTSTVSGAVTVTAVPVAPVAAAATAIGTSGFTANWAAAAGATGYSIDVSTVNTFASFVTGYSNLTLGNVLATTISGLTPGVTYYYRVRGFNSCGPSDVSNTITAGTTPISYCTPSGATFPQDPLGITNFTLATINNSTGLEVNNYGNFSSISTSAFIGVTLPFSITFRTGFTYDTNIWIDWNNDGDFTDAGELVYNGVSTSAVPTTLAGTFAIPLLNSNGTSTLGPHRLRIGSIDAPTFAGGALTPCRNGAYQAFEDYTLNVIPVPACAVTTPSLLTTANVTATSATLVWTDPGMTPNSVYNYFVSTTNVAPPNNSSDPAGMGTVTGALTANVTGLTIGVTYYFWVRVKCNASNFSNWIGSANFFTANLDVINMTTGSSTTCNAKFYDSGGFGGDYSDSQDFTYTISPQPGKSLKVVFNSFDTENNYDGLVIYNGPNNTFPIIPSGLPAGTNATTAPANSFYGSTSPGTIITPLNGSLTFQFKSDTSVVRAGWDATVTCVTLPTITNITPASSCVGATPTITLTGTNFLGVTSVAFNGLNATSFSIVDNTTITVTVPAGATTGVISVANANASNVSATSFIVNPIPATPNAGADAVICSGQSATLTATSTPTSNSLFTSLLGGNGCTNGNMFNITTGLSPVTITAFDITPNLTAVQSVAVYYRAGTYVGNETNSGVWTLLGTYSVNGVDKILINMPVANLLIPASSTYGIYINYNAAYSNGTNTYSNSDITINTGVGLCSSFGNLQASRTFNGRVYYQGNLPLTYNWTPATGLSATNIFNPVASPTTTQTYSVSATLNGCTSPTDTVVVTVNPTPDPIISAASANICANSVIPLTVSGTASTFTWSSNVGSTLFTEATGTAPYPPLTNTPSVFVKTPSTATITVTATNNPSGCQKTASVVFTVNTRNWNGFQWSNPGSPLNPNDLTANLVFLANTTFSSTGNVSGCSCTINSGATINFNAGHTMSLANGLTVLGTGSMIFNDDSSLVQINNVANTGNITYRRITMMRKFDYTYWSSPVAGESLFDLSPNTLPDKYFSWNATTYNWENIPSSTIMAPAKGYIARGPQGASVTSLESFTGSFIGIPNNGDFSVGITKTGANDLNLIGNPYPSAVDASAFILGNAPVFGSGTTLYFWTHNTPITNNVYAASDYAVWNFSGGTGTGTGVGGANNTEPSGKIAAGQGFMIKGINEGTIQATFRNAMRVSGNNTNFYRMQYDYNLERDPMLVSQNAAIEGLERHRIWLDLTNDQGVFKEVLLAYVENATNNYEEAFDGDAIDIAGSVGFYSLQSTHKLAIQGKSLPFDENDIVPLGLQLPVAGSYNIQFSNFDGLFTDATMPVYLEDKLMNVVHNLRQSPYSFVSESGTFEDRFVLRFTPGALGVPVFTENTVVVFKNEVGITINTGTIPMKSVAIYDVTGRLITSQKEIYATQTSFTTLPSTNQVLLVQITSETGVKVTKKVVY